MNRQEIIRMVREVADKDKVDPYLNEFVVLTPEEIERFAALIASAETQTLRAALDAAVAWAAPMADAPKSARPAWFDQARAALSHKGPIQ